MRAIVLGFTGLDYMNSGGIGLLVTLLVRAQRQGQRVLAFGLSDHYRQIFELTRLDEAVGIHDNEARRAEGRTDDRRHAELGRGDAPPTHRRRARGCGQPQRRGRPARRRPIQGFGKMWQKTYQVRLPADRVSPAELIAMWKQRFPEFWPDGNRFYAP